MRAYHLMSEKWACESLRKKRLKLARFDDMNDPFELLGVELKSPQDRADFQALKQEMARTVGMLCFSKTWSNPVLWSHYADKHRGLCLGFDIPDEWAVEVSYTGARLKADLEHSLPSEKNSSFGHKLLTTKFSHWRYEKEVRTIIRLENSHSEHGHNFLPYCNALRLREVIIGPRNELTAANIEELIADCPYDVEVIHTRLAFRSFKVVRNRSSPKVTVHAQQFVPADCQPASLSVGR
jgi:hypothetical protein